MTYTAKDLERARGALRTGTGEPPWAAVQGVAQAFAELREECAKVCDDVADEYSDATALESTNKALGAHECSERIRELGK